MAHFTLTFSCDAPEFQPDIIGGWRREAAEILGRLQIDLERPISSGEVSVKSGVVGAWAFEPSRPRVA